MNMRLLSMIIVLLAMSSCKEDDFRHPFGPNDGEGPGKVEVLSYEPIPGGAVIEFKGPADKDLLYVRGVYKVASGKEVDVKVSAYDNKMTVEGFCDTDEKEVLIYAVDRSENVGEPVRFAFVPGLSPLRAAFSTIDVKEAFGGATVSLENEFKGNLIVEILTKDEFEQWQPIRTEYTAVKDIRLPVRGLDPKPTDFGVILRDRWDNVSDTLFAQLTPLEEYELNKSLFKDNHLDGDEPFGGWGHILANAWDGITSGDNVGMAHTNTFASFPISFTIDLGVTTKLSRYVYWSRNPDYEYMHGNMKDWEIYGRSDKPVDGSWDGWTFLLKCESFKPSGLPSGQNTAEDIEHARNGEEFEFDIDVPEVRYLRFKALSTFSGTNMVHFHELTFYGQKK